MLPLRRERAPRGETRRAGTGDRLQGDHEPYFSQVVDNKKSAKINRPKKLGRDGWGDPRDVWGDEPCGLGRRSVTVGETKCAGWGDAL